MSKIPVTYKRTDLQSDQEVKWCPGCGDYTILASVQNFMAEMGISKRENSFCLWNWLCSKVPILYEHIWCSLNSW